MTLNGRNVILLWKWKKFTEPTEKFERSILSAAKCRPMILVSRNTKYTRTLAGIPREGRQLSNDSNGHALCPLILTCALTYSRSEYVSRGHAYWPFRRQQGRQERCYVSLNEKKRNVSYFSSKWSQKCRFFTARCTLVQSAALRFHVVRPSVCPFVCNVGGSGPHRLEILETNSTDN